MGGLLELRHVLYVPSLPANLLSVAQHPGTRFVFRTDQCQITCPINHTLLGTATRLSSGRYVLDEFELPNTARQDCLLSPATLSYITASRSMPEHGWAIDSACTRDMTWDVREFTGPLRRLRVPIHIRFGNGSEATCTHEGTVHLKVRGAGARPSLLVLPHVLHVPALTAKLLSVTQHSGTQFTFSAGRCEVRCPVEQLVLV